MFRRVQDSFWERTFPNHRPSDEQHRQIGRILGFPECCVEAWIANYNNPREWHIKTGAIIGHWRTVEEVDQQRRDILKAQGGSYRVKLWLLGASDSWPVDGTERMIFVPCNLQCPNALALGKYCPPSR